MYFKQLLKSLKSSHKLGLGENVGDHLVGGAVVDFNHIASNHLTNEMVAYVNVFGVCMILVVLHHGNR